MVAKNAHDVVATVNRTATRRAREEKARGMEDRYRQVEAAD